MKTFKAVNSICLITILISMLIFPPSVKESLAGERPQIKSTTNQSQSERFASVKPGDAIQILVYPDTTSFLHGVYYIDGDGNIFLPIIGKVRITDMSEQEFIQFVKDNYSNYLKGPNLQVRHLIGVSLLGGFNQPGLYYIDPNATLWQLLELGGGTMRENGLRELRWERNKNIIQSDLISYLESGKSLQSIGVKSSDQFWTPTPDQAGFLEKAGQIVVPFVSIVIASYSIYLTYYLIESGR